jgi:hypothetical protein
MSCERPATGLAADLEMEMARGRPQGLAPQKEFASRNSRVDEAIIPSFGRNAELSRFETSSRAKSCKLVLDHERTGPGGLSSMPHLLRICMFHRQAADALAQVGPPKAKEASTSCAEQCHLRSGARSLIRLSPVPLRYYSLTRLLVMSDRLLAIS